jgi:serine/threonine protein kinase
MPGERWLCPSCGALSDPAPETPPSCSRCDAPLHVGKFGLLAEVEPERSARVYHGREAAGRADVTVRIFPEALLPSVPLIRQAVKRASSFAHPMIAAPLDAGTYRNRVYIVESSVPGDPITRTDLTLREAVSVIRSVACTLDEAHSRGIVHPDLRAENVRVSRDAGKSLGESGWRVYLTCFGIATGGSVRANVCELGAILYTVATGRSPRGLDGPPVSPSSLNPLVDSKLESVILMAMETEASRQPPSAAQIASELTRWIEGGTRSRAVPKAGQSQSLQGGLKIRPRARTAAAIGVAGLIVLIFLVTRKGDPSPGPTPAPLPPQVRLPEQPPREPAPPSSETPAEVERAVVPAQPPLPEPKQTPAAKVDPPPEPSHPPAPAPEPQKPAAARIEPAKPVPQPAPAPPPDPSPLPDVGEVRAVHRDFGVFVALESASSSATGDALEALRNGHVIAHLAVERITAPDRRYPKGCAVCKIVSGETSPGDKVRRVAK